MSSAGVVMMVLVCGVVWGGFVFLLGGGVLAEGRKVRETRREGDS